MAQDIVPAPLGEVKAASTASGGTALTTTASLISLFRGTQLLRLSPRNASTAVVVRYSLNPWLVVLKTTDALVAAANLTDGSYVTQDADTSTTLSMNSFPIASNGGFLYVGSHIPFRGVRVIIGNTNSAGGSTLTVKYWNGSAWTDITATDGTLSTDTFRQTGNVTWTVPTDWVPTSLNASGDTILRAPSELMDPTLFWTRWQTSVVFDSSVTVTGLQSMNRSTTYDEVDVSVMDELRVHVGSKGISCVEALTDAGTANLLVRCATIGVGSKFI